MPEFNKSPLELDNFYQDIMQEFPQAVLRKTFGYPCAYVNGNMANGLFSDSMFLRLSPEDERSFLLIPGASPFAPMPGRGMKGYVVVPPEMIESTDELREWITRSLEYTASLPPKKKKPPKPRI